MFIVLKSSETDFPKSEDKSHIKWYHAARKMYEDVEITQLSGRTMAEIKITHPKAFEECLHDIVPVKYETITGVFEKPEDHVPVKAVPKKEVGENKFRCSDCQLGSETIGGVRRHITKMHGKDKANVIDISTGEIVNLNVDSKDVIEALGAMAEGDTEKAAKIIERFDIPKDSTASEEIPEPESFKYKCEQCGLKTPSLGGVRRHITKMHGKGACNVIDLATNLPLVEEEVNDDEPTQEVILAERKAEADIPVETEAPEAPVVFTRPKPVKRDF